MSETFEIHITGNEYIHEAGKQLGIKTIEVELLNPEHEVLRVEHMTSHVVKLLDFESCKKEVDYIVNLLRPWCALERVKIECLYYDKYIEKTIYLESHFPEYFREYPLSRNVGKDKLIETIRTCDKEKFTSFRYFCNTECLETEMCLFDSNQKQDNDWFALWGVPNIGEQK